MSTTRALRIARISGRRPGVDARGPPAWSKPFAGQYAHVYEGRGHRPLCVGEQHVWRVTPFKKPAAARERALHQPEKLKTDVAQSSLATRRPDVTRCDRQAVLASRAGHARWHDLRRRERHNTNATGKLTDKVFTYVSDAMSCTTLRPRCLDEQVPFEKRWAPHLQQPPSSQSHRTKRPRPIPLLCPQVRDLARTASELAPKITYVRMAPCQTDSLRKPSDQHRHPLTPRPSLPRASLEPMT